MKVKSGISHRWPLSRPAHMRCVARLGCNINFFIINHHHHRRHRHHHHHHHHITNSRHSKSISQKRGMRIFGVCIFKDQITCVRGSGNMQSLLLGAIVLIGMKYEL